MKPRPQPGDTAPDFTAPVVGATGPEGELVTLSSLRGRKVVLYFYPKDDTPGCTVQACGLRDAWAELEGLALLFGVSTDPVKRHRRFIEKYGLPFRLISDEDRRIVEAYGVWVEKSLYGKTYHGTERTTFVIDEEGRVAAVLPRVKPADHASELLAVLRAER